MNAALVVITLACCASCQNRPAPAMSVHDEDRAFLDRVADSCGLPRKTFELIGNTHVQMQPPTDADYKSVDCALEKLGKAKALNLGFVGNEYYSNEAQ